MRFMMMIRAIPFFLVVAVLMIFLEKIELGFVGEILLSIFVFPILTVHFLNTMTYSFYTYHSILIYLSFSQLYPRWNQHTISLFQESERERGREREDK